MADKSRMLFWLTWTSVTGLILLYIFTGLAGAGVGPFNLTISEVSHKYETEIIPASYAFLIWNLIFVWQAAWVAYSIAALFRKNSEGPVYLNPVVLPVSFHVSWLGSCAFFIGWLFAWSNEKLFIAFIMLLLLTGCGYVASAVQGMATADNVETLRTKYRKDLIMNYVLIQNGLDIFYAWCTVATLLNLSMALTHDPMFHGAISSQTSSMVSLSILLVLVVGWSVSENTIFFRFFSFVYTWYGVLLWASIAILVKNLDLSNPTTILTCLILATALAGLCIKIAVYVIRTKQKTVSGHSQLKP